MPTNGGFDYKCVNCKRTINIYYQNDPTYILLESIRDVKDGEWDGPGEDGSNIITSEVACDWQCLGLWAMGQHTRFKDAVEEPMSGETQEAG